MLYFLSGISGNVVSALYFSQTTSVGASGAIFGFMGFQLAYLIRTK
jgi:membrane associated rhomboid family serine protease